MAYKQIKGKKAPLAETALGVAPNAATPLTIAAAELTDDDAPVAQSAPAAHDAASSINPTAIEPAANATKDLTMDTTTTDTNAAMNDGHAVAADFSNRAKQAMEKGSQMIEEMSTFGKGNVEAIVESGKIVVKGIEAMGQDAAEFTRKSLEGATEAMKTLAATRSPTEFMKLQSDYARSMFDAMVAETSRSTEAMFKLANDVAQPISNRVALAAEKVKLAA